MTAIRPYSISSVGAALAVALMLLLTGGLKAQAPGAGFLATIEDLPLMPGFVEALDEGMVFESPSGRIAEAFATGAATRDGVLAFYADTLPQLGWTREGPGRFRRENEILELEITGESGSPLTVRFALAPAGGG